MIAAASLSLLVCFFVGCSSKQTTYDGGTGHQIGIYDGPDVFAPSLRACFTMVQSIEGTPAETLHVDRIHSGRLSDFDLLIFPNGDPRTFSTIFGPVGRSTLREWVASGGNVIGFGGGATILASDTIDWPGVGVVAATAIWPVDALVPRNNYDLVGLQRYSAPAALPIPPNIESLYYAGPEFHPLNDPTLTVLYTYVRTGSVAAICGDYGLGRYFVAGFLPEFEEGTLRDSTNFADGLTDPESEWDIISSAIQWCRQR